jgi:hypothetical protein
MENIERRKEPALEVRELLSGVEGQTSCEGCRNLRPSAGFLICGFFDKPTSGNANGCPAFSR